jgi:hypothetical protein
METITICLRPLVAGSIKMLVEVRSEEDYLEDIENLLKAFVLKVNDLGPIEQPVDIYIGIWAQQTCFNIPKEFAELIAKTGWNVMIDFND